MASLPRHSNKYSRHDGFTIPQLFACLAVRKFLGQDYRGIEVLLGDRAVAMPAWLQPAMETIRAEAAAFRPADLPLGEQARLVLCRRLVREGLLEITEESR